ncbi:MAG: glutaminyl-peptide cyclotransferase [Acidobacteriia bacterium]|nr:glutaminyl-peptide cyclotransferase [Terriglobia bacterium]
MKDKNRLKRITVIIIILNIIFTVPACTERAGNGPRESSPGVSTDAQGSATGVPFYTFQVVKSWPHDPAAYTQGLEFSNGVLYESTGLFGRSSLRKVDFESGKVLQQHDLAPEYFGEGITVLENKIFQLTWQSHKGFVYDRQSFQPLKEFSYSGEGWGLTHDDRSLIMSDGTNEIRFLDPVSLQTQRTIRVMSDGQPLSNLNELEYIKGEIYANVYGSDYIVRLDPGSGKVLGWVDLTGLLSADDRRQPVDVLNGIAYDPAKDRLVVTGKLWPKLFEIRLMRK